MDKCKYCDKEGLCKVGKDKIPVCEEHYIAYLKGVREIIDRVDELWEAAT